MDKQITTVTNPKPIKRTNFVDLAKSLPVNYDTTRLKQEIEAKYHLSRTGETKKVRDQASSECLELFNSNIDSLLYLHKHTLLLSSVHKDDDVSYGTTAYDLTEELKAEYSCVKPSEVILCQLAANAYVRIMRYSHLLMAIGGTITHLHNQYYSILSKDIDRAERQYHIAINSLKSLRQPEIKVSIKTNNAFIAQNQQLNSDLSENNNAN
jgi:hypothetical protein